MRRFWRGWRGAEFTGSSHRGKYSVPIFALEFERFKTWVAQFFPKSQEFDGAAATHPVVDDRKRLLRVSVLGDVGEGDEIQAAFRDDGNKSEGRKQDHLILQAG